MKKRGQIGIEYLIVVGFITMVIIVLLGVAVYYTITIQDKIKMNQLEGFSQKVISSSETVYYAGEPSKVTVEAYLPSGVSDISYSQNALVFNITLSSGLNIRAFSTKVPLDLNISSSSGVKTLKISALSNQVLVSEGQ